MKGQMENPRYNETVPERAGQIYSPRSAGEGRRIDWFMLFSHGPDRVRNNLKIGSTTGAFIPKREHRRSMGRAGRTSAYGALVIEPGPFVDRSRTKCS